MHRSDDIANLFNRFGGSAESYLEIEPSYDYAEETATQLIAALGALQPVAPVSPIKPSLPVPDETQGATPVATDDVPSALAEPEPVSAPAVPPAAVAAPTPVASVAAAAAVTSLSRLLAEIEQQRQARATHVPAQAGGQPGLKAKVIAVVSAKGGVGKSTLAAALASAIKRGDGRTLALDLDPQNALCLHLGGNDQWPGVAQDSQQQDWRRLLRDGFSCHCLAYGLVSEEERGHFESGLRADPTWLARHLAELGLGEQDTVIIDTPTGATAYLAQALAIADVAVVVTLADAASYASLEQMDRLLAPYRQREIPLQCRYVVNQLDTSRQFSLDVCEVLKRRTGNQLLGVIRQDHFIGEALAYERNPLAHLPITRGCQDILDVAGSLCELLLQGTQESHLS